MMSFIIISHRDIRGKGHLPFSPESVRVIRQGEPCLFSNLQVFSVISSSSICVSLINNLQSARGDALVHVQPSTSSARFLSRYQNNMSLYHIKAYDKLEDRIGVETNLEFRLLTSQLSKVLYKGQQAVLNSFSVRELLPDTNFYTTYEGSLTMPGCHETVTWLVMNKPIYITKQQLYALKQPMQGEQDNPKAPLVNNFRPTQAMHHRLLRTNIDFNRHKNQQCPTMYKNMFYKANTGNPGLQ
ncbi:putative carbonic anhydrase-like protein 2 [Tachypleus tridentatus]|uniref:putative carbonic anhydrase-like protein 2 n=1 Tax=Tachypleus tridentatus TaxID=6853 RepID=UPI003FD55969